MCVKPYSDFSKERAEFRHFWDLSANVFTKSLWKVNSGDYSDKLIVQPHSHSPLLSPSQDTEVGIFVLTLEMFITEST